jgi:hypothetical protein
MVFQRDPVSVLFDEGAVRLLERAYARQGQWVGTRLANPGPSQVAYTAALGIDPFGPDGKTGEGRLNARTRWARGFVRSLQYQHKRSAKSYLGLIVEVGRALPGGRQAGTLLVPGRAIRVKVMRGGSSHIRRRGGLVYTEGAGRSDPAARDW